MFRTTNPKPKYQEKVELFFSCENLKNMDFFSLTDPQIRVYAPIDGQDVFIGETEVISNNLNPKFSKSIVMSYIFEAKQPLHFQIVDVDEPTQYNLVGDVYTSLGAIVGSRGQSAMFQITNNSKSYGDLVVTAEKVGETAWTAYFQIQGESLENQHGWFLTSSPYFKLIKEAGQGTETLVTYESEAVRGCLSPRWAPLEISLQKLCNGDRKKQIVLQVYTRRVFKEVLIGQCKFTVEELLKQEMNIFWLSKTDDGQQDCGTIRINRFEVFEKLDFLDYLKAGVQLNMMVAIDFTASNGFPDSPASLHAINSNGQLNQYQKAVQGVGEILLCYDYDQRVSVYGFGGVPSGDKFGDASHCFPLSGSSRQPYVIGLRQVMGLYENALKKVQLSGPTHFAKIMEESIRKARYNKENGSAEYLVLLILTDGVIHDMDATINCLIEAAYLPLSVIIVGIGSANFSQMEILDGDKGLYNKNGLIVQRDLVQFVPFDKFKGNKERLASEVLQEIPMQLARYMNDAKVSLMRAKEEELDEAGTVSGSQDSVQDPDLYKYAPPISEMAKIMQTEEETGGGGQEVNGNGIVNDVNDVNGEVEIEKEGE